MRKYLSTVASIGASLGLVYTLSSTSAQAAEVTLYKNPQCRCCEGYAEYLRENGHTVTVKPTHQLVPMSRDAGIPSSLQGCHLAIVDDYVVSGHVPVGTIDRLLSERPDIKGITLPGMPAGSPGMTGRKTRPFKIYEVGEETKIYAVE
jgi:hypothetical protein